MSRGGNFGLARNFLREATETFTENKVIGRCCHKSNAVILRESEHNFLHADVHSGQLPEGRETVDASVQLSLRPKRFTLASESAGATEIYCPACSYPSGIHRTL